VERYGATHRLLRLGSCDFDFDVTHTLWGGGTDATDAGETDTGATGRQVATLREALADVYENTSAEELRAVVHPPKALSFFAPMPAQTAEAERLERFRREAQLLAQAPNEGGEASRGEIPLHVTAQGLYAEDDGAQQRREWFHVLAVSAGAHARFERVTEPLSLPGVRWTVSMEGAAHTATALQHSREQRTAPDAPFTLSVGRYREHLELALARHGRLHYALHAPGASPADSAYFALSLLERLDVKPAAVGRVFVYGIADERAIPEAFSALGRLTGARPQPLDFRPVVGLNADHLAHDFAVGPYAPCIGAAL
jgi:hypothetical protein